jgi:fatty acid desaturase
VLWVLPLLTLLQPILRFRAICEHGAVRDEASPLLAARTNLAPRWVCWLLFPHHVNYHLEHHLYPAIPHYNLPRAHDEMKRRGLLENAEVPGPGVISRPSAGEPEVDLAQLVVYN